MYPDSVYIATLSVLEDDLYGWDALYGTTPRKEPVTPACKTRTRAVASQPFVKGDLVTLARDKYRGKFRHCKGRIGRIADVSRIKSTITSYGTITVYKVEGLLDPQGKGSRKNDDGTVFEFTYGERALNLLAEDMVLANDRAEDWEVQRCLDRLAS